MSDSNVFKLSQPGTLSDPLTEVLRSGARALLAQAVAAEVAGLALRVGPGHKGRHVTEVLSVDSSTAVPTASRRSSAQATTSNGSSVEMTGTLKWFYADRGYGFITPNGGGEDVFVHVSVLERSGIKGLSEGQTVVLDVVEGQKGPEAARVRLI